MSRPLLLDIFCGAGGASRGYHDAGFDVIGVDIVDQPRYPYEFIKADAIDYLIRMREQDFAAVHASPPCQRYSTMSGCRPGLAAEYADLIGPVRELLEQTDLPWVIENVPGAPLKNPIMLCGFMFGRELYRHRLFESNVALTAPPHPPHTKPGGRAGHWQPGEVISVSGHCAPIALAREVMGIDWTTRAELAESIPPYFASHVGRQLLEGMQK